MLGHAWSGHVISFGNLASGSWPLQEERQNVPPGGVSQRSEEKVSGRVLRSDWHGPIIGRIFPTGQVFWLPVSLPGPLVLGSGRSGRGVRRVPLGPAAC